MNAIKCEKIRRKKSKRAAVSACSQKAKESSNVGQSEQLLQMTFTLTSRSSSRMHYSFTLFLLFRNRKKKSLLNGKKIEVRKALRYSYAYAC